MKKLLAVLLLVVYPAYGQDYTVTPVEVKPPLQNIYETGGTNLNLADDGMATDIKIGFDFEFYGNIFDTVNISNNGFITFTGLNSACCQGEPLPWPGMDNSIMALWTDLISIDGINPYYKSYAVDGNRVFTVGWYNTIEFYNLDATNTFEITLYEGSNNILFNYENTNVYGHSLTAGIQGTNEQSEQIYYGNSTQSLSSSAYLFEYIPPTPPEPPTPIAPDCTINPADVSCIINSAPTQIYVADIPDNNDRQTEPVPEEQVLGGTAPDLQSLLASEQTEEMAEKEKEEELKDEISTDVLQLALAIESQETDRERNSAKGVLEDKETTSTETLVVDNKTEVVEIVETKDSVEDTVEIETLVVETVEAESNIESTEETVQLPVFVQNQGQSTVENTSTENVVSESANEEAYVANQAEQSTEIDSEFAKQLDEITVRDDDQIAELNTILANGQQKTFDEETSEDEQLTMAYVQPGVFSSITPFNVEPNVADKEAAGVLSKAEEKSDAEKRAEEVIAANKEQQEEINKNYMEADQSGIVAAMGADTDVNAYRSRMLNDNNIWYKPEDIYKNIVYKDNVRGAYFLEKGNTDTYKKMVKEQYK